IEHLENVLPRNALEDKFARKNHLDENVRLACQTYLTGPVTLRRHLQEDIDVDDAIMESVQFTGSEQMLAILFCDIRDFTGLCGRMLPYDMFYVLNRYYQQMGECVLAHRGYLHQYYGDGMMALFGFYARDPRQICLDAVTAGMKMLDGLKEFNRFLETNFKEQFKIGIGIHFGEVLAGKIGHIKNRHLSVLGDVVNTTQRIQDATKQAEYPLLISDQVYWELGATILKVRPLMAQLKGKPGEHRLYEVMGFAPGYGQPWKRP
ncbi:MAG: adenylate/guanylate cyclase domain-containing protein, partial [bacterium]